MSAAPRFDLPAHLEAADPPEPRDDVRMLVASRDTGSIAHAHFRDLPDRLTPGDLLVVNTSATLPAALRARRADDSIVDLHLSTPVPEAVSAGPVRWVVEVRQGGARLHGIRVGERLVLAGGASADVLAPYVGGARLWVAQLHLPEPLHVYLAHHGRPIRYRHQRTPRPLSDHQTVYAQHPGSAEMPSAGRPFTPELVTTLVARGIAVVPIVLHAGVSSLQAGEPPYAEWFRVPPATAAIVGATKALGGRVVAVGTTVVRALETTAGEPGEGWTRHVVDRTHPPRVVDGLLTGWHEPEASHLQMLEALAGEGLIQRSYDAALVGGYRWHEFGDVHLVL